MSVTLQLLKNKRDFLKHKGVDWADDAFNRYFFYGKPKRFPCIAIIEDVTKDFNHGPLDNSTDYEISTYVYLEDFSVNSSNEVPAPQKRTRRIAHRHTH